MNNFKKTITYILCLSFFVILTLKKDIIFDKSKEEENHVVVKMNFEKDFQDAIKKAEQENKLIFIDCYTDWCYWCKVLDTAVFEDHKFAYFMNKNFINLKVNTEEGFGKAIAMKYFIRGYPTAIILDKNLNLKGKITGYSEAKTYKANIIKIMGKRNAELNPIIDTSIYDKLYGQMFREKIEGKYKKYKQPNINEINNFFSKERDYMKEHNFAMLWRYSHKCPAKLLDMVYEDKKKFKKKFGEEAVNTILGSKHSIMLKEAVRNNDSDKLNEIITLAIEIWGKENKDIMRFNIKNDFYMQTDNCQKVTELTALFLKQNKKNDINNTINGIAWDFYENIEDTVCLKSAISWMESLSNLQPYQIDTHAALLYKIGDYENARIKAEEAISQGIAKKDSMLSTRSLLTEINSAIIQSTN